MKAMYAMSQVLNYYFITMTENPSNGAHCAGNNAKPSYLKDM